MKKLTIFLFVIFTFSFPAFASVPLDADHFPDPVFREVISNAVDNNHDNVLSDLELSVVENIRCENKGISSVEGIEYLPNLKNLRCEYNNLTTLNVASNSKLKILNCSCNQITTLDVSNNPNLWNLQCLDNQITSLDVSKNTVLDELWCSGNKLTSLILGTNKALRYLTCYNNAFTRLDISNCPKLVSLVKVQKRHEEYTDHDYYLYDKNLLRVAKYVELVIGDTVIPGSQPVPEKPAESPENNDANTDNSSSEQGSVPDASGQENASSQGSENPAGSQGNNGQTSNDQTGGSQTDNGQKKTADVEPVTIPKAPASVKAKAKKNKVTVSWKKIKKTKKTKPLLAKIKSVQVQYSTDKKFKKNVVTKSVGKDKTKVVLKLQKKTTYYIRVRYKGKDGVSRWSSVTRIKTK